MRHLESDHFWFRGRRELVRRLLRRFVRPSATILDVGAGSGFFMRDLAEEGFRTVGIDPLAEPSAARLIRGDALRLPFRRQSFDAITILDVLEHVDDAATLREMREVLKNDGIAIVTVPASRHLWSSRDVAAGHRRRYSRRMLEEALSSSGFRPIFVTHYQFFLFPLMIVARTFGRNSSSMRDLEERPGALVNGLFRTLNVWEARCAPRVRWPWGSSLVAVCGKQ
ncbi:MAG TPA: class I SAM-dependent methyltransferase [Thermoanaerobaculia bacterium]